MSGIVRHGAGVDQLHLGLNSQLVQSKSLGKGVASVGIDPKCKAVFEADVGGSYCFFRVPILSTARPVRVPDDYL